MGWGVRLGVPELQSQTGKGTHLGLTPAEAVRVVRGRAFAFASAFALATHLFFFWRENATMSSAAGRPVRARVTGATVAAHVRQPVLLVGKVKQVRQAHKSAQSERGGSTE